MKFITSTLSRLLFGVGAFLGGALVLAYLNLAGDAAEGFISLILFLIGFGATAIPAIIFSSIGKILAELESIKSELNVQAGALNAIKGHVMNMAIATSSASTPETISTAPSYWNCESCATTNKADATFCKGCGKHK